MPIANVGAVPDVVADTLIATDWGNAVGAASRGRVVQRFNSLAERDASITAPINGMLCYVLATDVFYGYRQASGWTAVIGGPRDTAHAMMGRAAAWTAPATDASVPWDTVVSDSLTMWNAGQVGFIVPYAGMYHVTFTLTPALNAGTQGSLSFYQGGAKVRFSAFVAPAVTAFNSLTVAATLKCTAGQLVQTAAAITGGRGDIQAGAAQNFAAVNYLGHRMKGNP